VNIKQKVFVSIVISLLVVGALGGALYTMDQAQDDVSERSEMAHTILRRVFDLSLLTSDYATGHGERARVQWQSEYDALVALLQEHHGFDEEEHDLVEQLDERAQDLSRLFQRLVGNYENGSYSPALERLLLGQLMVELNGMTATAERLSGDIHHEYRHVQQQTSLYGFGFVAALVATLVFTGVVIHRGVLGPLEKLRQGTEVIADGDLGHRTRIERDDEIGELSGSFDQMARQLQTSRENLERQVKKRTRELRERVKELNCLYRINELGQRHDLSMDELFQEIVELIPPSWQYPEITCARLTVDGAAYTTDNFETTPWMMSQDIVVNGETVGHIDVGYLEEKPMEAEGPFLKQEQALLDTIATQIGGIIKEKHMQRERRKLLRDLKRPNEELEQFAYVASHDLQEPLRMVSSYLQLLQRRYQDKLDEDADDFIEYAVDGARRMKQLINDLLKYSRVTTRGDPFLPVDVNEVMDEVRDDLQHQIADTGATVTHDELPTIHADRSQLRRVLQNLVSNAIKYRGNEPPEIHVGAEEQPDAWRFAIADNGVGIPKEQQDRIFVIFQRLHGHDEAGGGTGIGLALCKRIVERHGGDIWVDSEPGEGATFYFTIPKDLKEKKKDKQGEKNE
jgi:signal transduction histidine kinase/HAMP domain-containing protein